MPSAPPRDPPDSAVRGAALLLSADAAEEQRIFLTERKCTLLQGYLFSPPLPPDEFGELLRTGIARPKPEAAA